MPRHRGLALRKFVTAINESDPGLLEQYFLRIIPKEQIPPHLSVMYYEYVQHLLDTLEDERIREMIFEDFRRMNDICEQKLGTLVWVGKLFGIEAFENETPQALAMRLFLNYEEAFEYAWARYCIYGSASKISRHNIPCEGFEIDADKLEAFKEEIKGYFADLAKGADCRVSYYDEGDQVVILIARGSYFRTIARWEGGEIKFESFRPASEDVLLYDKRNRQLCVQTPLAKDREQYIRSFTNAIVGDPSLAENPDRDKVYTLTPIQHGTFSWNGNEHITSIIPLEAKLKVKGATEPVITIRSKNLRETLENEFEGASLSGVELIYIKFRFTIETEDKAEHVTFVITPPDATDLAKKKHADIISSYLKENGVQLG
jgi:hypothetical protein